MEKNIQKKNNQTSHVKTCTNVFFKNLLLSEKLFGTNKNSDCEVEKLELAEIDHCGGKCSRS